MKRTCFRISRITRLLLPLVAAAMDDNVEGMLLPFVELALQRLGRDGVSATCTTREIVSCWRRMDQISRLQRKLSGPDAGTYVEQQVQKRNISAQGV